ncbi:Hexaprenyldihydroxybenzoate methyltransferase, mitochondrial-like protein [Gossypium australe]|uniref:Hexaprenyldihydroxybenzoate methyltransferase, mitochondrial-like protein n=1 Tax=Gossypium australe TaxID=47621 RepID=A0A5B6V031_9ROSI|nr:Hexaprenyldihydroxybenzoate methyltransferase, mitochondrial-like protein [Gossypium australe]
MKRTVDGPLVPKDRITWDFFQSEFKKKYVSKRYLDQKKKEFLELKQRNKSIAEYERYACDFVPNKEEMCICFQDGLNDEIKMLIRGTEIREFVVLSYRTQKMEEVYKHKKLRDRKARDFSKKSFPESFSTPPSKKNKEEFHRTTLASRFSRKNKSIQNDSKYQVKPANIVGSVRNAQKLVCKHCKKLHRVECRTKMDACFRYGSTNHFVRNYPRMAGDNNERSDRQMSTP